MPLSKINSNSVANTASLSVANLGVGGASSGYSIDVNASDGVAGLHIYANSYPQIRMHDSASGNGSNDGLLLEFAPTYTAIANYEARPFLFTTNGVERIRIPSDAGGITFPASQAASTNANTLDDYEEGTWTPNISSNNGTGTFTKKVGSYVKIGKQVTIWFVCDYGSSLASGTTQYLGGLPFNVGSIEPTTIVGSFGGNGPSDAVLNLMTLSGNRGVLYVYRGGGQETTTLTFAGGFATYWID